MNKELQDYYEERFSMCSSKGWKQLIEDAYEMKKAYNNVKSCTNLEFAKGQLDVLDWLLDLEKISKDAYTDLLEESNADV